MALKERGPPAQNPEPLWTISVVAELFVVSRSLVYQMVDSGKLPYLRIGMGRGAIRFKPEDVRNYLESCRREKNPGSKSPLTTRLKHIKLKPH